MADEGIFATTEEVKRKAGANVSATSAVELYINDYMTQVESLINSDTKYNWSDAYSGLNVDVKGVLKLAASSKAAMMVISFDMSGMALAEAETRLDVLNDQYNQAIKELKVIATQDFVNAA